MKSAKTNWTPNKVALAKKLGVTRTTLDTYLNRPGAPQPVAGAGYDFDAVVEFVAANGVRTETAQSAPDLRALKVEELRLKCDRLKLALDRERGLVLLKDEVRRVWLAHLQQFRAVTFASPSELAPALHGQPIVEIEARLKENYAALFAILAANPTAA